MKIYLDTCCLNRPFDDQRQPRIRLEAEAVTLILEKARQREWTWIGSEVLVYEIQQTANTERKERLLLLSGEANQIVESRNASCLLLGLTAVRAGAAGDRLQNIAEIVARDGIGA